MRFSAAFFATLSLSALASAITITSPTSKDEWSSKGQHIVKFDAVSTDPSTITLVLVSDSSSTGSITNANPYVLTKSIATSSGSSEVTLPSTVQSGALYRINAVKGSSGADLTSILAQSAQFSIENKSSNGAGSSRGSSSMMGVGVVVGGVAGLVALL